MTLLAAWSLAPSTASATCGDYVTSRAQREAHGMMKSGHDDMPGHPPSDNRLPCSGPSCSEGGKGQGVPAAPVVRFSVRSETWCDTARLPVCARPDAVAGLFDPPLLWPPLRSADLGRPPCPLPV